MNAHVSSFLLRTWEKRPVEKEAEWNKCLGSPFIPANPQVRYAVDEASTVRWIGVLFFSFEFSLLKSAQDTSSGRLQGGPVTGNWLVCQLALMAELLFRQFSVARC